MTKAKNHNEGKPRWSLLLRDMDLGMNELLKAREFGAQKYDRMNWAESIGEPCQDDFLEATLDSATRHIAALHGGELIDKESGCTHAALACLRMLIFAHYHAEAVTDPDAELVRGVRVKPGVEISFEEAWRNIEDAPDPMPEHYPDVGAWWNIEPGMNVLFEETDRGRRYELRYRDGSTNVSTFNELAPRLGSDVVAFRWLGSKK